jgi:poly(A) polymerase
VVPETTPEPPGAEAPADETTVVASVPETPRDPGVLHRDNTFGTPEEDAFRRDFTINGLFYDIATFSVIDYVGGLEDLDKGVIRSIGDPRVRFVEDPVRMLRAVVMAARLDFQMDSLVVDAIAEHCQLLATASPARLLEEYYKILRSGFAEATFRELSRTGLLEVVTPELETRPDAVWESLACLDRYRQQFPSAPSTLTNTVLIGALLTPIGAIKLRPGARVDPRADRVNFGILPVARKELERQLQILQMLPRLLDPGLPPRAVRGLLQRPAFADALVWLEIFGDEPEVSEAITRWKEALRQRSPGPAEDGEPPAPGDEPEAQRPRRRRRRRRHRGRGPAPAE